MAPLAALLVASVASSKSSGGAEAMLGWGGSRSGKNIKIALHISGRMGRRGQVGQVQDDLDQIESAL